MKDGRPSAGLTPFYRTVRFFDWLFCTLWFRVKVEGLANIPKEGGAVLAANHQSYADILMIGAFVPRHVTFVARDTLAESKVLAFIMEGCGAILIRRGASDRAALRSMADHLSAGELVAIYPEGTRSRDGQVGTFKGGALMAARLGGVPLIPIGIRGAYQAWPRGRMIPWPRRIAIRFGTPIDARTDDAGERLKAAVLGLIGDGTYGSLPPIP